ncbi:MAG: methyltransferase [Sedimenticola sp.]|nr:methyltransferase [Sedimenticola sp.]
MQQIETPKGPLTLYRYPRWKSETLRAWDAADEYLLSQIGAEISGRILIINDAFGALSCALAEHQPVMLTDSYLSLWSTRENLQSNGIAMDAVQLIDSVTAYEGLYDWVLVRVTKTLGLLEDELIRLRPHLKPETRVVGCGMVKQIHNSTLDLFEHIIGPTKTSLARKKARLIYTTPDLSIARSASTYPVVYTLEGTDYSLVNYANVFSRDSLDIGTRLLLKHIPSKPDYRDIVDLGCGNGVVGLIAAERNPQATVHFVDESAMAVASARETLSRSGLENSVCFLQGDGLTDFKPESADLILCNPPFHHGNVVGDEIAWRMFNQARRVLRKGGELRVIGNRHLNYHVKLKRLFGDVQQLASDRKFVVLQSFSRA